MYTASKTFSNLALRTRDTIEKQSSEYTARQSGCSNKWLAMDDSYLSELTSEQSACAVDTSDFTWLVEWTLAVASVCALVAAIAAVADLVILLVDAVPVTATHVGVLSGCFSGGLVNWQVTFKMFVMMPEVLVLFMSIIAFLSQRKLFTYYYYYYYYYAHTHGQGQSRRRWGRL